ncbi:sulfotransferase [Pseudomonas syringae]|nr:sulfotransferase [Pseudomonas syringae]
MKAIFVCGCPRSGNTLIGNLLGTAPSVAYCGELGVPYFALHAAPQVFKKIPTVFKEAYLARLVSMSLSFVQEVMNEQAEESMLCDSTPWNYEIVEKLNVAFPGSLFVFVVRHFSGVIFSMRRSFESGYQWAGPTDDDRAHLWCNANERILSANVENRIILSYDSLVRQPENVVSLLAEQLQLHGIKPDFDISVLGTSFATTSPRPVINFSAQEVEPERVTEREASIVLSREVYDRLRDVDERLAFLCEGNYFAASKYGIDIY